MLTPSPNDVSVQLLNKVLGVGWDQWATGSAPAGAGSILATMFSSLNIALMSLAGVVLIYTHVRGTADVARTGASRVNTWTFIRQSLAMMLLAPLPGAAGLNVLQVLVMATCSMSIGLADDVWNSGVSYVASNGGQVSPPATTIHLPEDVVAGMLQSAVIAKGLTAEGYAVTPFTTPIMGGPSSIGSGAGSISTGDQTGFVAGYRATGASGKIAPQGIGTVTVRCTPAVCGAVSQGLAAAENAVASAAQAAWSWTTPGQNGTPIPAGLVQQVQAVYANAVQGAIAANLNAANSGLAQSLRDFQTAAQQQGWATAGLYFFNLAKWNSAADANSATVSYHAFDPATLSGSMSGSMSAAIAEVDSYMQSEQATAIGGATTLSAMGAQALPGGACPSAFSGAWAWFSCEASAPALMFNSNAAAAMTGPNPIGALQALGADTISEAEAAGTAYIAVRSGAASALYAATGAQRAADSVPVFGSIGGVVGAAAGSVAAGVRESLRSIGPYLLGALTATLASAAVAAYYLPLLPAVIYTLAVVGWGIVVLEMLVAAPLWAFCHVLPEGDGMMGSSARAGYFHLLDVLARPTLLVFGFFLAILATNGGVWFVGSVMQVAFASAQSGSVTGVIGETAEFVILIGAIFATVTICVRLISLVPTTVMRWMGQSLGIDSGERAAEGHINAAAMMVSRTGAGAAGDAARAAMQQPDKPQHKAPPAQAQE
ncbi:TraY protein [Burkholderiales bacterium GJ-E10]|nr:TraY protein [Burkholderiales bacterium GJ-E10]